MCVTCGLRFLTALPLTAWLTALLNFSKAWKVTWKWLVCVRPVFVKWSVGADQLTSALCLKQPSTASYPLSTGSFNQNHNSTWASSLHTETSQSPHTCSFVSAYSGTLSTYLPVIAIMWRWLGFMPPGWNWPRVCDLYFHVQALVCAFGSPRVPFASTVCWHSDYRAAGTHWPSLRPAFTVLISSCSK